MSASENVSSPSGSAPSDPAPGTIPAPPIESPAGADPAAAPPPAPAGENIDEYEPLTPELVEEEAIRGDFVLRWAVVLLAFLLGTTRISETSALVRIKTGQYLAEHGVLPPATDIFSYTAADRPWTNLAWGFDLLIAALHAVGSFVGLSVFKAVVVGVVFWLIGRVSRPGIPSWWGSVCGVAALLGCHLRLAADPILVTFLGLALSATLLHLWRESAAGAPAGNRAKQLWWFVPLILVWNNLDGWAWLGLSYLLLFAAGDSLGGWLKSSIALPSEARRELWKVAGASVAATLVHPFGWKALAAPWHAYAVVYPAFRYYLTESAVVSGQAVYPTMYFPMTTASFWQHLDVAGIAALVVLVAAAATFLVNRARHDWAHFAVFAGFVLLAVACLHELPSASLVGCVVATLNGQAWYAAACRQTYSVERRDIMFSQGGRALTVLVIAAIAFFGGTGRLRDSTGAMARTGYGLDRSVQMQIDDLQRQLAGDASFDHRPFNTHLTQGDQLIWVGEQVFADSRVGVYFAKDEVDNLLAQHLQTRESLRAGAGRDPGARGTPGAWKKTFGKYRISHVAARLINNADYLLLFQFLSDAAQWEFTGLGPEFAVFYRIGGKQDPAVVEFAAAHRIDFPKQAFGGEFGDGKKMLSTGRSRGIRPPSFYQKYFWSRRRELSPESREARHLALLATFPALPRRWDETRLAIAYRAIRLAQEGLEKDPDDVSCYLALGQTYDFLARLEAAAAMNGSRSPRSGLRYLQTVAAYNQVLVGDPENRDAHAALMQIYSEAQKRDLALRHMLALQEIVEADPDSSPRDLDGLARGVDQTRKQLQAISDQVVAHAGAERDPRKLVEGYMQQQCLLRALTELEAGGEPLKGDLRFERLRVALLLETGRIEEAYEAAGSFAPRAEQARVPNWADLVAAASLIYGDYTGAIQRWQNAADEAESQSLNAVLLALAPHKNVAPWPITTTYSMLDFLYERPESIASLRMNVALARLEEGQTELARAFFHEVLATNPDTLNRPLAGFYLRQLSEGKEVIDLWSPSDRIFEMFEPEPDSE